MMIRSFVLSALFVILSSVSAFSFEYEDYLVRFGTSDFETDNLTYDKKSDNWKFTIDGKKYIIPVKESHVYVDDGEIVRKFVNGKAEISVVPSYNYVVVSISGTETPVFVDTVRLDGEYILAKNNDSNFELIYSTKKYRVFDHNGNRIF